MTPDIPNAAISDGTRKNWQKLKVSGRGRLTGRANKTASGKTIIPEEYFINRANIPEICELVQKIRRNNWKICDAIFSIGANLLKKQGIFEKEHVQNILKSHRLHLIPELLEEKLPADEQDLPGIIYQCLLTEGRKNSTGSYFTPQKTVQQLLENTDAERFLDPCCGSGAFLLGLNAKKPEQLSGCDRDPVAVLAAQINLLLKYPEHCFEPDIRCGDFLDRSWRKKFYPDGQKFDCIATNPPWGALNVCPDAGSAIRSKESFAHFLAVSLQLLSPGGSLRFLLPESFLSVKKHRSLRHLILTQTNLEKITLHPRLFSGVTTGYIGLHCKNAPPEKTFLFNGCKTAADSILQDPDLVLRSVFPEDSAILETIRKNSCFTLKDSTFALGIVTGNNREKLYSSPAPGREPVLTGKEIRPFRTLPAQNYLHFAPGELQQCAREACYRAPEKLIYKFISAYPVFAPDNSGTLVLNSANLLIPAVPGMSSAAVLAFLNSSVLRYCYICSTSGMKVLKSTLQRLPFPRITAETDRKLTEISRQITCGKLPENAADDLIFDIYGLTHAQKKRIIAVCRAKKLINLID